MLEGTDWANLRFVTPLDVVLPMGAPFLVGRGIDPFEDELGPALMRRLLLALPPEGGYFRPLAGHPTLAQALWNTCVNCGWPASTTTPSHRADAGQAWGTLVHGLLEHAMRHRAPTRGICGGLRRSSPSKSPSCAR